MNPPQHTARGSAPLCGHNLHYRQMLMMRHYSPDSGSAPIPHCPPHNCIVPAQLPLDVSSRYIGLVRGPSRPPELCDESRKIAFNLQS